MIKNTKFTREDKVLFCEKIAGAYGFKKEDWNNLNDKKLNKKVTHFETFLMK